MNKPLSQQIKEARDWAMENLRGRRVYCPSIDRYVFFNREGIKHGLQYKISEIKVSMMYKIEDIIKRATLYSITEETKGKKDVEKVYRLFTEYKYGHKAYFVYIIVFKKKNGHLHYDHGVIKEKEL